MLPGRQLIGEIENILFDLDAPEYELSFKLEQYILEQGSFFLKKWHAIKKNHNNKQEQLNMIFDTIQSEVDLELEEAEEKTKYLRLIDRELDQFIWKESTSLRRVNFVMG